MRQRPTQHRSPVRRGLSLLEVVLSMAITGGLLASVFTAVGVSAQRGFSAQQRSRATWLANDLLAEIGAKPCAAGADNLLTLTPLDLGVVSVLKSASQGGSRAAYDSVYDYANWASSPPVDASGTALTGFDGWARAVTVLPVAPETLARRTSDDGAALITVKVIGPNGATATASVVRTSAADGFRGLTNDGALQVTKTGVSVLDGGLPAAVSK